MGGKDLALLLPACFIGLYLLLEALDWGLCLAAPVIGRDEKEWGYIINLMRPAVDGNELWFIIASFMLSVMVKAPAGTPASYSNWMAFTGTLIVGAHASECWASGFSNGSIKDLPRICCACILWPVCLS